MAKGKKASANPKPQEQKLAAPDKDEKPSPETVQATDTPQETPAVVPAAPPAPKWQVHKDRGNFLFQKGRWADAVDEYKKGIEEDGAQPVLYANRAMALLKLNRNADVLADCDRSLQLQPDQVKVHYRRAQALLNTNRIDEARADLKRVLELEPKNGSATKDLGLLNSIHVYNGAHSRIASLSSAVKVEFDELKGRKLVAAERIPAGALLLREQAYGWLLSPTSAPYLCQTCCKCLPADHVLCDKCNDNNVRYCTYACRKEAAGWHKFECGQPQAVETDIEKMALLAQRVLLNTDPGQFDDNPETVEPDFGCGDEDSYGRNLRSALSLGDKDVVDITDYDTAVDKTQVVQEPYLKSLATDKDMEKRAKRIKDIMCNLITKVHLNHASQSSPHTDMPDEQAVHAFYIVYALTNHSCVPNLFRQNDGRWVELRAVRPLQPGDELTTTYGPEFSVHSKQHRLRLLKYHYGFDCDCVACTNKVYELREMAILSYHCKFCSGRAFQKVKPPKVVCDKCQKAQPYTKERVDILPDMITENEQTADRALKLLQAVGCDQERMNTQPCIHSLKTLYGYMNYYAYVSPDAEEAVDLADHLVKMACGIYTDAPHFSIEYLCSAARVYMNNYADKHGQKIAELIKKLLVIFVHYFGATVARQEFATQMLDVFYFDKYHQDALPL